MRIGRSYVVELQHIQRTYGLRPRRRWERLKGGTEPCLVAWSLLLDIIAESSFGALELWGFTAYFHI